MESFDSDESMRVFYKLTSWQKLSVCAGYNLDRVTQWSELPLLKRSSRHPNAGPVPVVNVATHTFGATIALRPNQFDLAKVGRFVDRMRRK